MLQPRDAIVLLSALTPDKGRGLQPFLANIRMAASLCRALEKVTPSQVVYSARIRSTRCAVTWSASSRVLNLMTSTG